MVNHVEPRAIALCFLNFPPPVHGVLDATVQLCRLCLAFGSPLEGVQEAVVCSDVVRRKYQFWFFVSHLSKKEM
jgi:hypothetical protein